MLKIIWESNLDGTIFYNEDEVIEYVAEHIDDVDLEMAMQEFSFQELFESLNEEKRLEIIERAEEIFREMNICEFDEEEEEE